MRTEAAVATSPEPQLVTVRDVPIVSTGTYELSTGTTTFTEGDMDAAVAAVDDPAIKTPRLKLGHLAPLGDAEPAFGVAENLRLSEDKQTIIADFTGVPRWLANIMPTAYPSRSVEGFFNYKSLTTGRTYQFVVTDVAMLGVVLPGVSTLEDLQPLYSSEEMPEGVELVEGSGKVLAAIRGRSVAAAVEVEDVRRSYYDNLTSDQTWWWIRAIRLDPADLIVDDDEGQLYRVPYTVAANGVISFEDPVPIHIEYQDDSGSKTAAAHTELAIFATRAESRPEQPKEGNMDPQVIRQRLGLAEDASDEEVLNKLNAIIEAEHKEVETDPEQVREAPDQTAEDGDQVTPQGNPPEENPAPVEDKPVTVDAATYRQLKAGAEAGAAARRVQLDEDRDNTIAAAIRAGKFPPARKAHYVTAWDRDPVGTKHLLTASVDKGGLAPGLVPVTEKGVTPGEGGDEPDAYPSHWFPEVVAGTQGNGHNRITTEA